MKKKAVEYSLKAEKKEFSIEKIRTSNDAVRFSRKFYHDDISIYESSFILLLNHVSNVIGYAKISQGGLCSTVVDIRIVAKYAIDCLASSVILVHNHPSGNVSPSAEDTRLSTRLKEGLRILDINFLDSIIIAEDNYTSMADEGMI